MQKRKAYPTREEAIPIAMHKVHTQDELCARLELYQNSPESSFNLPSSTHHWLICQNNEGPKQFMLQADNQEFDAGSMNSQQIVYIPPCTKTQWQFSQAVGSTHILIPDRLFLDAIPDNRSFFDVQEQGTLVGNVFPKISNLLHSSRSLLSSDTPVSNLVLSDLILDATEILAKELTSTCQVKQEAKCVRLSNEKLNSIRDYMWDNIEHNITLAELAKIAHLSPFHFSRVFKSATGVSPHQALIKIRVQKARSLIPYSTALAEIAYSCGFSDQAHFTRVFKSHMGFTPYQFRRSTV